MSIEDILITNSEEEEFEIVFLEKTYSFAKKPISWAKMNKILSEVMDINPSKGMKFDMAKYYEECLLAMLTKTPWELNNTRTVLRQLKPEFGILLEKHVPQPASFLEEDKDNFFVEE